MTEAAQAVSAWLHGHQEEMVALLERLAEAESPSLDPDAQRLPLALLAEELKRAGFVTRAVRGDGVGDHLYARPHVRVRGAPRQLLLGHVDTVWPLGTLATMPVRREDGLLYGPGVEDMKAGLVQLVFALRALAACEAAPPATPVVLINTDEEIGSLSSGRFIRLLARGATRAFVLEAGEGPRGRLKIARKGVGRFTLRVYGRAAHAGTSFEEGASAILELSRQVQRLFELNDPARGITVNVGTIDGGLRPNVVAPEASAVASVRAPTAGAAARLERAIRSLQPTLEGTMIEVEGGFGRPPMEPVSRNRGLLGAAIRLGHELGLTIEDAGLVGGGSDANTVSLYTATIDGLGPVGEGSHASHEHIVVDAMPERAALLALLLLEPIGVRSAARRRPPRKTPGRAAAIVGAAANDANAELVAHWNELGIETALVPAAEARTRADAGAVILGRLDVLPTLDGVEPGLYELLRLERTGARVLNTAPALLHAHDKLLTARILHAHGLPHPRSAHVPPHAATCKLPAPLVLKPRFGSWGADVFRCDTPAEVDACLATIRSRPWFRRHGALAQELVPPRGHDLRIVVAGSRLIGAIARVAEAGEWRTNVSLGATILALDPPAGALRLALAAANACGADLVGVDLLPLDGGYTILELNGAVDFGAAYSLAGHDIFTDAATAFALRR